jgi:hypothetical protein
VLSQMNWPSTAGAKMRGEIFSGLPIRSAATISVAKRSSKVLDDSSRREGMRSWTERSSANAVTAKQKISANQNDRIILEGERSTPSCYDFNLIRAATAFCP